MAYLQQILGTDKRNPAITICKNARTGLLHVFFGGELMEKLPDDRNDPQYKLLLARLFNAGVNAVKLSEVFGPTDKTMRNWGRALKSGDPEKIVRVLAGRGAHRKLTPEIAGFVRNRFPAVYRENPSSYSKQIRAEINDIYGEQLCAETLRPLFREMKAGMTAGGKGRQTDCECEPSAETLGDHEKSLLQASGPHTGPGSGNGDRNRSTVLATPETGTTHFVHHLGVLLFADALLKAGGFCKESGWLAKQWLAMLLLGSVNIEQSKLLDFNGLDLMLGQTLRSRHPQRQRLVAMACSMADGELLRLNAAMAGVKDCSDFYYDPHGKQCTTRNLRMLKGWCAGKRFADKVLHMDFIHAATGHPAYIGYGDNYDDLRVRFGKTVKDMRETLGLGEQKTLTFVLDRGIYSKEVFKVISGAGNLHIITWEKNYKRGEWREDDVAGAFVIERCRNCREDVRKYAFRYIDLPWDKDPCMRLLRVQATNPNGNTIEIGILSDDRRRAPEQIIGLIFNRWLQENDFKYLDNHFGINQITSYASVSYRELERQVEDRQVKSGEYKALEKERQKVRSGLRGLLLQEHRSPGKSTLRRRNIEELDRQDRELSAKMKEAGKEVSRLQCLIEGEYYRLDVSSKRVMDALKLMARNAFYIALRPFRQKYNNYRDDHGIFRNLTRAHGILVEGQTHCIACLYPTAGHPPAMRKIIKAVLDDLNARGLEMPDGSGRKIIFKLGDKSGIVIANANRDLPTNY